MNFFNGNTDAVLNELNDNELVIFGHSNGARLYAKIRGANAEEVGFLFGAAQASLERQIREFRNHVRRDRGNEEVGKLDRGLHRGRQKEAYHEGLGIRDVRKPENGNG